jgi:hypothetical protein
LRKILFLLIIPLLPPAMPAEEPPNLELELEAAHTGDYAYAGISHELKDTGFSLELQGYRLVEDERQNYLGLAGGSRLFRFAGERLAVAPGAFFVFGIKDKRGIAGTLDLAADFRGFFRKLLPG